MREETFNFYSRRPLQHAPISSDPSRSLKMWTISEYEVVGQGPGFEHMVRTVRFQFPQEPKSSRRREVEVHMHSNYIIENILRSWRTWCFIKDIEIDALLLSCYKISRVHQLQQQVCLQQVPISKLGVNNLLFISSSIRPVVLSNDWVSHPSCIVKNQNFWLLKQRKPHEKHKWELETIQ